MPSCYMYAEKLKRYLTWIAQRTSPWRMRRSTHGKFSTIGRYKIFFFLVSLMFNTEIPGMISKSLILNLVYIGFTS